MLNKYSLIISPSARNDLRSIYEYISIDLHNKISADNLIRDFNNAFVRICYFPKSFPVINNEFLTHDLIRKKIVNNYIIFYLFIDDVVRIMRIVYSARDYENIVKKID